MHKTGPLVVEFSLVNGECRVFRALKDEGFDDFRLLGIRPEGSEFVHLVEVREKRGGAIKIVRSEGCELCRTLSSCGAFLLSAKAKMELMRFEVVLPNQRSMKRLKSKLKLYPRFRKISILNAWPTLTDRQEEVLLTALRMGYFDTPRRVKTRELAEVLGVSAPTFTELLRRALRKLVVNYYLNSVKQDGSR
mgnify:CR=1 FL=1